MPGLTSPVDGKEAGRSEADGVLRDRAPGHRVPPAAVARRATACRVAAGFRPAGPSARTGHRTRPGDLDAIRHATAAAPRRPRAADRPVRSRRGHRLPARQHRAAAHRHRILHGVGNQLGPAHRGHRGLGSGRPDAPRAPTGRRPRAHRMRPRRLRDRLAPAGRDRRAPARSVRPDRHVRPRRIPWRRSGRTDHRRLGPRPNPDRFPQGGPRCPRPRRRPAPRRP